MMGRDCVSTTVSPVARSRHSSVGTCCAGFLAVYLVMWRWCVRQEGEGGGGIERGQGCGLTHAAVVCSFSSKGTGVYS